MFSLGTPQDSTAGIHADSLIQRDKYTLAKALNVKQNDSARPPRAAPLPRHTAVGLGNCEPTVNLRGSRFVLSAHV